MNYKKKFFEFWILDPFTGIPLKLKNIIINKKWLGLLWRKFKNTVFFNRKLIKWENMIFFN